MLTMILATLTILAGLIDPHGKIVYRINRLWTWTVLRVGGVKLRVTGLEKLDSNRQYIFMVNHQSNVDIPVLVQSLPHFQLRWIAKKELVWVPFFGWAMWATKHITVDRADPIERREKFAPSQRTHRRRHLHRRFSRRNPKPRWPVTTLQKGGLPARGSDQHRNRPGDDQRQLRILLPSGAWRLRSGTVEVVVDQPVSVASYRPGNLRLLSEQITRDHRRPSASVQPAKLPDQRSDYAALNSGETARLKSQMEPTNHSAGRSRRIRPEHDAD